MPVVFLVFADVFSGEFFGSGKERMAALKNRLRFAAASAAAAAAAAYAITRLFWWKSSLDLVHHRRGARTYRQACVLLGRACTEQTHGGLCFCFFFFFFFFQSREGAISGTC